MRLPARRVRVEAEGARDRLAFVGAVCPPFDPVDDGDERARRAAGVDGVGDHLLLERPQHVRRVDRGEGGLDVAQHVHESPDDALRGGAELLAAAKDQPVGVGGIDLERQRPGVAQGDA